MTVTLIVEDGTIVAGANTYEGVAYVREYALNRGVTLSSDDDVLGAMIIQAMDVFEGFEESFKGLRASETQELSFPRSYFLLRGVLQEKNVILKEVKEALCEIVIAISKDVNPHQLQPEISSGVKRVKLPDMEREFSASVLASFPTVYRGVWAKMSALTKQARVSK